MSTIRISEIFGPTVQGEGALIGRPTVFVRTGGCDYRCSWCDTLYAVLPEYRHDWRPMAPDAILARVDALTALSGARAAFDVVFVDPPYEAGLYAPLLDALTRGERLRPGAFVVVEHRSGAAVAAPPPLELDFDRAWGDTTVKLMTYSPESAS